MTLNLVEENVGCEKNIDFDPPPCEFDLRTPNGLATYERLARLLAVAGKLTIEMHLRLSRYALAADAMHFQQTQGMPLRASMFHQLQRAERDLGLAELERCAAPQPAQPNKFSRVGFANRLGRTT